MRFDWTFFLAAIGLAFIFEGLPYFLWAEKMPKILLTLATRAPSALRSLGLSAILLGILLIFFARSL